MLITVAILTHKFSTLDNSTMILRGGGGACNRRYLFILATPRSGSTTMFTTLNALPGVRLSGENPDVFLNLWQLMGGKEKKDKKNEQTSEQKPRST